MYVRDHARPAFHKALDIGIEDYDMRVFRLTSEITKQVFPITLDLDHPGFIALRKLNRINAQINAAEERGGILGKAAKAWHMGRAGLTFARLYMIPTKSNAIPAKSRLEPVW
jgi:magnesium-protoporphyrin IX monomethyl ester (oxidative) cyclase